MAYRRHPRKPSAHDVAEVAAGRGSARDRAEVAGAGGLRKARRYVAAKRRRATPVRSKRKRLR